MRTSYLDELYKIARQDSRVFALIGDNGIIVYDKFREDMSEQFLNMGICESHMVGFAAGLASRGKIPFVYTIGAFLAGRAYEFIKDSVCFQNLNVKLVGTGAGVIYSKLGATHHATEDLAVMRAIPGMHVFAPGDPAETEAVVPVMFETPGTCYLRIGRGHEPLVHSEVPRDWRVPEAICCRSGSDVAILSAGGILTEAGELFAGDEPIAYGEASMLLDSALQLGLPEARLPLAEACILLATAPKSNSVVMAIDAAVADVKAGHSGSIPRELQNKHADGSGFEREQGYRYPHDYSGHWVRQQYLPDELKNRTYYEYGDNKTEQSAKKYWDTIKQQ